MKKYLSISLAFLMAIVITYAGSGINAYSFCCEDCHTFGIEAITDHKCCDVHIDDFSTSDQTSHENEVCETSHQQCELDRLNLDLQERSTQNSQPVIQTPILKSFLTATLNNLIQNSESEPLNGFLSQTQKPPNLSKLVYFSLLETLII